MNRREALQAFLTGALQAAGTVVLASSTLPASAQNEPSPPTEGDVKRRAEQVAAAGEQPEGGEEPTDPCGFLNTVFRNGGFRNGGFLNGGFRNGFGNRPFGNGGFRNGGFGNGGFLNRR